MMIGLYYEAPWPGKSEELKKEVMLECQRIIKDKIQARFPLATVNVTIALTDLKQSVDRDAKLNLHIAETAVPAEVAKAILGDLGPFGNILGRAYEQVI